MKAVIEAIRKDRAGFMTVGETWYSLPKGDKLPGNIEKGMEVEFFSTQNGTWNNVQGSVTVVGQGNQVTAPANSSGGKFYPVNLDTKDHVIMRQNALTAASNFYRGYGPQTDPSVVLEAAEQFVAWTTGRA